MQKWEYRVDSFNYTSIEGSRANQRPELESKWLNELGDEGWELVSVVRDLSWTYAYFKRPKVAAQE